MELIHFKLYLLIIDFLLVCMPAIEHKEKLHNSRVDERFGLRTYAMISAPIIFEENLFGVVNILSHHSDKLFSPEWPELLSALAVMYGAALAGAERLTSHRGTLKAEIGMEEKSLVNAEAKTGIVGISQAVQEGLHLCLKAGRSDIPGRERSGPASGIGFGPGEFPGPQAGCCFQALTWLWAFLWEPALSA
jgi:hypothetical protein